MVTTNAPTRSRSAGVRMKERSWRKDEFVGEDLDSCGERLALDLICYGIVDYMQSTHTRRYREGRDFLLDGKWCQFLIESVGGNYQSLVTEAVKNRAHFIALRRRDYRAAATWWRKHCPWAGMPQSPIAKYESIGGADASSNESE